MKECLKNIVTVGAGCDPKQSISGYQLIDAPEISTKNLSKIVNEDNQTGDQLARDKIDLAVKDVRNDFLGVLASNNVIPDMVEREYDTGNFSADRTYQPKPGVERGFSMYKSDVNCRLRKIHISKLEVYPINDENDLDVKIYDGDKVTTYTIDHAEGGKVNSIQVDYWVQSDFIRVLIDGTIEVGSAKLTCYVGCNGRKPNDCGYTKGYNGTQEIGAKEGFGVGVTFSCKCDYDQLLCELTDTYVGKLVWMKARILLAEEWLHSNRNNNWTIYNRDELPDFIEGLKDEYAQTWNTFVDSLYGILKSYHDCCLDCRRGRWIPNA